MRALRALLTSRLGQAGALMFQNSIRGPEDEDDEEEEEEDDLDDESDYLYGGLSGLFGRRPTHRSRALRKPLFEKVVEPVQAGVDLERSGEFGRPPEHYAASRRKLKRYHPNVTAALHERQLSRNAYPRAHLGSLTIPNSAGVEVAKYDANVYSGQFSKDGSFFYTCAQDFRVRIYDMTAPPRAKTSLSAGFGGRFRTYADKTTLRTIKTITANDHHASWTITDADLSPDNSSMIYSTIGTIVNLVRTRDQGEADECRALDFASGIHRQFGVRSPRSQRLPRLLILRNQIWSIRFSADAREIVAGATGGYIYGEYQSGRPTLGAVSET
jgi:WD repeat-containing protein 23